MLILLSALLSTLGSMFRISGKDQSLLERIFRDCRCKLFGFLAASGSSQGMAETQFLTKFALQARRRSSHQAQDRRLE